MITIFFKHDFLKIIEGAYVGQLYWASGWGPWHSFAWGHVEKLKIKSNDYVKVRMKTKQTIELVLIKGDYTIEFLEGNVFLPE